MSFEPVNLLVECRLGEAGTDLHGDGVKLTVRTSYKHGTWSEQKTSILHPWAMLTNLKRFSPRAHLGELLFHDRGALEMLHDACDLAASKGKWLRIVLDLDQSDARDYERADEIDYDEDAMFDKHREWLNNTPWESMFVDLDGPHEQIVRRVRQPVALAFLDRPRVSIVRDVRQRHSQGFKLSGADRPTYLHVDATDHTMSATVASFSSERLRAEPEEASNLKQMAALIAAHSSGLAVLHVTAHGTARNGVTPGRIHLPDGEIEFSALADVLRPDSVGLLLLSVCRSTNDKKTGMVSYLEKLAMPAFVGMQEPISVFANRDFVQAFFAALEAGGSLDEAMAAARERLLRKGPEAGSPSWPIPVLYMSQETRKTPYLWATSDPIESLSPVVADQVPLLNLRKFSGLGLRRLHLGAQGSYSWHDPNVETRDSGEVRLSPEGKLAGRITNGRLLISRLELDGGVSPWAPIDLAPAALPEDTRLLAIAADGKSRATVLVSYESATAILRVAPNRGVEKRTLMRSTLSADGVIRHGRALLVELMEPDSVARVDAFPQLRTVWSLDAAFSDGVLRVAAVGLDQQGQAAVHVNGQEVLKLTSNVAAVGLPRDASRDQKEPTLLVIGRDGARSEISITSVEQWSSSEWR